MVYMSRYNLIPNAQVKCDVFIDKPKEDLVLDPSARYYELYRALLFRTNLTIWQWKFKDE